MSYCFKCGTELVEGANFCHVCAAPVPMEEMEISAEKNELKSEIALPKTPENASTYVISEPVQIPETTDEDRQKLLDKIRKKLLGEVVMWRVVSIVSLVMIFVMFVGLIASVAVMAMDSSYETDEYYYDESYMNIEDEAYDTPSTAEDAGFAMTMFFYFGFIIGLYCGLPSAIVGLVMSGKAAKCKKQLYNDCSLAVRRYGSVSVIIIPAIFNPLVLIFTIPLFSTVSNNSRMLLEISDIQKNYYGY